MNYQQGIQHMITFVGQTGSFNVSNLTINYPGYKKPGDYMLTENGVAPKHTDIVQILSHYTNVNNFNEVVAFLDDVYTNGLHGNSFLISNEFKEKIFWITLQEEINYPQPRFAGRKLPFQRFFEATLIHRNLIALELVTHRTNNRGRSKPTLIANELLVGVDIPSFYQD